MEENKEEIKTQEVEEPTMEDLEIAENSNVETTMLGDNEVEIEELFD